MAKSKKALKALKRRKEAQKRSRVVKERQDYTAGGRVKAFTGINIGQDQIEAATKAAELLEAMSSIYFVSVGGLVSVWFGSVAYTNTKNGK